MNSNPLSWDKAIWGPPKEFSHLHVEKLNLEKNILCIPHQKFERKKVGEMRRREERNPLQPFQLQQQYFSSSRQSYGLL
jgi:hypothetical protein